MATIRKPSTKKTTLVGEVVYNETAPTKSTSKKTLTAKQNYDFNIDKEFERKLKEYAETYDIDSLSSPNDRDNLNTLIRNGVIVEQLQRNMHGLLVNDLATFGADQKKLTDAMTALTDLNLKIEKQLSIDRKTRKQEQEQSVADYIQNLKLIAREFLDDKDRITKVFCKKCQIMVGRMHGVYDTTYFKAEFQCPQCKKLTTVERRERDTFFDVKNADWRKKYPIEIVQAKVSKYAAPSLLDIADDVILDADDALELSGGELDDDQFLS